MCNLFCLCALDDSGMNCTKNCFHMVLLGAVEEGGRKALSTSNLHNHKLATNYEHIASLYGSRFQVCFKYLLAVCIL